jgi:hypothetical protein
LIGESLVSFRGWRFVCCLATTLVVSSMCSAAPFAQNSDEPANIFARHANDLASPGVRVIDGFAFSTVHERVTEDVSARAESIAPEKAAMRAVRAMLRWRLEPQVAQGISSDSLREAVAQAAVRCIEGTFNFVGLSTVHTETKDGLLIVVCAVPESRLAPVQLDRAQLIDCLHARMTANTASVVDALVYDELRAQASGSDGHSESRWPKTASQLFGIGVASSLAGQWVDASHHIRPESLVGWTGPASAAVAQSGSVGKALMPLSEEAITSFSTDDLLALLATRLHDPEVKASAQSRLRSAGFVHCAKALEFAPVSFRAFEDQPGGVLEPELRAKLFRSALIVATLLSDGQLGAEWGPSPSCLKEATDAFNQATPESIAESIELLADGMGSVPNVDAMSLLAAALLATKEPRIAEPLARAAFYANPRHPFAGANALRACMALEDRERARALLPKVAAQPHLGSWAKEQIDLATKWLNDSPDAIPVERVEQGDDRNARKINGDLSHLSRVINPKN